MFPVSQTANINAGASSKIIFAMNILINRLSMRHPQPDSSYTHTLSIYPQN
jgi:hypothetical protein